MSRHRLQLKTPRTYAPPPTPPPFTSLKPELVILIPQIRPIIIILIIHIIIPKGLLILLLRLLLRRLVLLGLSCGALGLALRGRQLLVLDDIEGFY